MVDFNVRFLTLYDEIVAIYDQSCTKIHTAHYRKQQCLV